MADVRRLHGAVGLAFVGALFVASSPASHPAERPDAAGLVAEMNGYADLIGRTLVPDEVARLKTASSSRRPEIRALCAVLLYRADPAGHRSALSSQFAVHDYAQRAKGVTEEISQEEFVSRLKQVEQAHPSLHPTIAVLVSFVRFRDANLWFPQGSQKLSVSRFLRGAFFAQAFKGSKLDAVAVANEMDEEARLEYERDGRSKR